MPDAQQDDEIGAGRYRPTPGDLHPANPHGALVRRSFLVDAQRWSIAWNRQPCFWQFARSRGNTSRCNASRTAFRSLKVELSNTRNVNSRRSIVHYCLGALVTEDPRMFSSLRIINWPSPTAAASSVPDGCHEISCTA